MRITKRFLAVSAAALVGAGVGLLELAPERANLESRFLALLEEP